MQNEPVSDFAWTEQLSVGNEILDSDHKKLLEIIRKIDHACQKKESFGMLCALKQLNACLKQHFLNEELFAHAFGIPFVMHHQDHQNMLAEINLTIFEMEKNGVKEYCAHYHQFLKEWLIKHIGEKDMPMKQILDIHPYSFKIEGMSAYELWEASV